MKQILVALALGALPAATFAQSVFCHACDHIAPYYRGVGGFIGTVAEGADEVVFVASCGNVTTSGEAHVQGDTATQLFDHRNGLACDQEGGTLEIAGLTDGGWYWITDDVNSAVGSLIGKDILDNETTDITSVGAGVTMTVGSGAVYLKETATGRVGILPNILAVPTPDDPTMCGAYRHNATTVRQTESNCMLGDGATTVRLVGPTGYGRTGTITSGMVYRNQTGPVTVTADGWWAAGGQITFDGINNTKTDAIGTGYPGLGTSNELSTGDWTVALSGATPGASADGAGITITTLNNVATITIADATTESDYCPAKGAAIDATVEIFAAASTGDDVIPRPKALNTAGTKHFSAMLTVKCPPAAASMGWEPVPDEPFPTGK